VTELVERNRCVLTVNVALVAPAVTVTLDGTVATDVSLLERATVAPPLGAGALRVTVPVELFPPLTDFGLSVSDDRTGPAAGGVTVSVAPLLTPPNVAEIVTD
jgi:hypothetical protein